MDASGGNAERDGQRVHAKTQRNKVVLAVERLKAKYEPETPNAKLSGLSDSEAPLERWVRH